MFRVKTLIAATALSFTSLGASASTIDFETIPDGAASAGQVISDQFLSSHGVTFSLMNGATGDTIDDGLVLADVGNARTAFPGFKGGDAVIDDDKSVVDDFVLTDNSLTRSGLVNPVLLLQYQTSTAGFSADIIDIDFKEAFEIRIYSDLTGVALLDTYIIKAGDDDTGNGVATQFSFARDEADVRRIEIERLGARNGFFGTGFDNFVTGAVIAPVPLPAGMPLMAGGLGLFALMRRKG